MYHRLNQEAPLVRLYGVFRNQIHLLEGTALIVSGTIGAGVLGIPYVVVKVGIGIGLLYIVSLGLLMMGVNLLVGEIATAAKEPLQIVGLAKKYLGPTGGAIMLVFSYALLLGALMIFIIGEGDTLSALFGGPSFWWSTGFFMVAGLLVAIGIRTIKTVELFLSLGVLSVVFLIALFSAPHLTLTHWQYSDWTKIFLPYGVLLFAFHATTAVPEAHAILKNREATFKKAILTAGTICIIVYALFAVVVVGVTGPATTEIATIGLGQVLGRPAFILGNLFAILAMGT
ncbi:MAG: hypothetical protein HY984_02155, partial [Candidatus Magasanikbacteria bacterium]|nr:hypothetical protein [Candidatus Magasanikbacteria bacterium]